MDGYGVFLTTLRTNAGLSLEVLAKIVASSKSTLSRLENGEISDRFEGERVAWLSSLRPSCVLQRKRLNGIWRLQGLNDRCSPKQKKFSWALSLPFQREHRRKSMIWNDWKLSINTC